jgi:hypothetical protein
LGCHSCRAKSDEKCDITLPQRGRAEPGLARQVEGATGQGNQNDLTLHFGLGKHKDPVRLEIRWTDGARQELECAVDRTITVTHDKSRP